MADATLKAEIAARLRWRRLLSFGAPVLVLGYLAYTWFAFDVPGLIERAKPQNAVLLGTDAVAYKVHVSRLNRRDELTIAVEGERTATYTTPPDWVVLGEDRAEIDLDGGYRAVIDGPTVAFFIPGYGEITARATATGVESRFPDGPIPDWVVTNTDKKLDVRPSIGRRVQISRAKIEVHRYFFGWENFWFDFNSDLNGKSLSEVVDLAMSGDRLHADRSNAEHIFLSFWRNQGWQHNEVFIALLETILMAVLGTFVAAFVGLPLAFLAASNFTPSAAIRFAFRRLFDFLRGVDALIWSLIFIRAFGLGPLTGALAIAFTDTGTLGKLFSEALENIDNKQVEGVRSTGANQVQRYKFGVIPQILPVFISQSMYYLESNTRSATVIGALGAGGIGLILVETMKTQRDWENTTYIIVLIILLVFVMDNLSTWLRRRLITG